MMDLQRYFKAEQQFYLDRIDYDVISHGQITENCVLNCTDNINAQIKNDNQLQVTFTRALFFEPACLFKLTVSFGAILTFNEENKNEVQWEDINIAKELRNNGEFVLANLINRTSLLVSQITSSFGQSPIITPPNVVGQ